MYIKSPFRIPMLIYNESLQFECDAATAVVNQSPCNTVLNKNIIKRVWYYYHIYHLHATCCIKAHLPSARKTNKQTNNLLIKFIPNEEYKWSNAQATLLQMEDIDCGPLNIWLHQTETGPLVLTYEEKIITTKHPLILYSLNIKSTNDTGWMSN